MTPEASAIWERVGERAGSFPPEAFAFVHAGLRHTVETIKAAGEDARGAEGPEGERHITGQELCMGIRDLAVRQFGMLAKTVLNAWGIRSTQDIGKVVFILVESGVLRKSDRDSFADFDAVYDFEEAFESAMKPVR